MKHRHWLVDLDGTLYRPTPVKLALAAELALFGLGAARTLRRFRHEHERLRAEGAEDARGPFELQLERTASALGVHADAVRFHVEAWMIERPGKHLHRFRRVALLAEIEAFKRDGGRTALVSDYPARRKLEALGARELFDVVIANGEAGGPTRLKPAPDGFLAAARALDAAPEHCLVIGDRDDADGAAARAAGMEFRWVR